MRILHDTSAPVSHPKWEQQVTLEEEMGDVGRRRFWERIKNAREQV